LGLLGNQSLSVRLWDGEPIVGAGRFDAYRNWRDWLRHEGDR
jgi:hypothetical protein